MQFSTFMPAKNGVNISKKLEIGCFKRIRSWSSLLKARKSSPEILCMQSVSKNATTGMSVEKTMAKVRQLLARKDVREMSLQSTELGTRFTIKVNTKAYDFWLPGASGLVAFSRVIQEQLTRAEAKAEQHDTE
jgi:hypothetical protein